MANLTILSNDEVAELITVSECIPIIENLFKNLDNSYMPPKTYLNIPNGDFRAMPAIVDNTAGIKWCGVHMDDTGTKRKVNIFAKVLINDIHTGELLAIMDGEALTAIRTAAVTGVATKYLAPTNARIAAFIGCGKFVSMFLAQYNHLDKIEIDSIVDINIRINKSSTIKKTFFFNNAGFLFI